MTNSSSRELVIVMPAYNEAGCIEAVVQKWMLIFDQISDREGRMVVVNDGSKDSTGEILDRLAAQNSRLEVIHQENAGHGAALLTGYKRALELSAKWVFHVDSDDQFIPADFHLLYSRRHDSRFILGCRAKRHDAMHRLIITKIVVVLNFLLFRVFIKDSNVPFRLIEGGYLKELLSRFPADVFAPNIFLSVIAARDGQKLMSIAINHQDRKTGKVSIVRMSLLKACLRSARELLRLRAALKN